MIGIHPIEGLPEVHPGDDLAALLEAHISPLRTSPHDVLVVTQKIVSKSENRFVDLANVVPGDEARRLAEVTRKDARLVELVLAESVAIVRAVPHVLIARHRSGLVMANAGIDQSNLGRGDGERVLLLPADPDASAARLHAALGLAIVISDSFGRPWRYGVTGVAIGAARLAALNDRRGMRDRDGRVLEATQIGLADSIAAAAQLAMGEGAEGIPAVLVTGLVWDGPDRPAAALLRPLHEDLFA